MLKVPWMASAALAVAMLAGCEKENTVTPPAPAPAAEKTTETTTVTTPPTTATTLDTAKSGAKDVGTAIRNGANATGAALSNAGQHISDAAKSS